MKRCPKGHQYPDKLKECPVCEKDNELQTVFVQGYDKHSDTVIPSDSTPATESINMVSQQPVYEPDIDKTVILDRRNLPQKNILTGWLIELDYEDIPVNSYQIFNKRITIGRQSGNDVVLNDNSVSGNHCSIEFQKNKYIIHDNNSANGIIIDNKVVKSQMLEEDQVIILGRSKFKIKYLNS